MKRININNLTIKYKKGNVAVEDLTTEFEAGKISVIIGESGAGKSTLLKAILGQIDYSGNILFDDINADNISTNARNISYVSQDITLYPHLTVFDNIAFPLKLMNTPSEEIKLRVKEIADDLEIGMLLTRKPKQLSLGQQQRVAIGRALIKNPDICLFDEPFSALDEQTRFKLRHLLKKMLLKMQATTIYVTHNPTIAEALADKIYVMNNGHIVISGTQSELLNSNNELVKQLLMVDQNV